MLVLSGVYWISDSIPAPVYFRLVHLPRMQSAPSEERSILASQVDDIVASRRLFYVRMTLAANRLLLVCDRNRASRFIKDLDPRKIVMGAH